MKEYIECVNNVINKYFKMLDEFPDAEISMNIMIEKDGIEINLEPWESISNYNVPCKEEFSVKFPEPKKTKLF